ncbi:unnamed protein product [Prunus armeniaca]|uniref:Uncharacterized protein n=1 Tax=Prunus armeniaca TaxID=36596 RepID=A0A6J5W0W9_PRUAR|nr:unnamed protein product [Prunus armeniaca]CAB4293961.1 unnamed protein product [Prunus armeniaca]
MLIVVLGTVGAVGDGMSLSSSLMNNLRYGQSQQNNNHGINWKHEVAVGSRGGGVPLAVVAIAWVILVVAVVYWAGAGKGS